MKKHAYGNVTHGLYQKRMHLPIKKRCCICMRYHRFQSCAACGPGDTCMFGITWAVDIAQRSSQAKKSMFQTAHIYCVQHALAILWISLYLYIPFKNLLCECPCPCIHVYILYGLSGQTCFIYELQFIEWITCSMHKRHISGHIGIIRIVACCSLYIVGFPFME